MQGRTDVALGHPMLRVMLTGASGCGAEGHMASLRPLCPARMLPAGQKGTKGFFLAQPTESQFPDTPPDKIKTKIKD